LNITSPFQIQTVEGLLPTKFRTHTSSSGAWVNIQYQNSAFPQLPTLISTSSERSELLSWDSYGQLTSRQVVDPASNLGYLVTITRDLSGKPTKFVVTESSTGASTNIAVDPASSRLMIEKRDEANRLLVSYALVKNVTLDSFFAQKASGIELRLEYNGTLLGSVNERIMRDTSGKPLSVLRQTRGLGMPAGQLRQLEINHIVFNNSGQPTQSFTRQTYDGDIYQSKIARKYAYDGGPVIELSETFANDPDRRALIEYDPLGRVSGISVDRGSGWEIQSNRLNTLGGTEESESIPRIPLLAKIKKQDPFSNLMASCLGTDVDQYSSAGSDWMRLLEKVKQLGVDEKLGNELSALLQPFFNDPKYPVLSGCVSPQRK
jgi:hypothetical protein